MTDINTRQSPEEALGKIVDQSCKILNCDRATVYLIDNINKELVAKSAKDVPIFRIPINKGLAGTVAKTGKQINIADAQNDRRFNN